MSVLWLVPAAFVGLVALAVPILVHLLTRQERHTIEFPSLRFLQATRLSAIRRHRIRDWLLLVVRAAIIAAAVAALAGPLLITAARERSWSARTARAIVAVDDARAPLDAARPSTPFGTTLSLSKGRGSPERRRRAGGDEAQALASRVFAARAHASEAMRSAVEWLATQPPAARELLVVGDLREGTIDDGDVASVPRHVGIRFVPQAEATPTSEVTLPVLTLGGRASGPAEAGPHEQVIETRRVELSSTETVVRGGSEQAPIATPRVEVRAAPEDQRAADAALAALLAEGVAADLQSAPRVIVMWPGGTEPSASEDLRVIRVADRPRGAPAVQVLRDIATEALDDPGTPREPRRISAADLARWSRPPDGVPSGAPRRDEGDRRWLWGAALVLLTMEWLLRRESGAGERSAVASEDEPARPGGSQGYAAWAGRSATRRGGGRVA